MFVCIWSYAITAAHFSSLNDHFFFFWGGGGEGCSLGLLSAYRESFSICVRASFTSGFEGGLWDLILLVLDHCLSFYIKNRFIFYCIYKVFFFFFFFFIISFFQFYLFIYLYMYIYI